MKSKKRITLCALSVLLLAFTAPAYAQFTTPDWSNANLDNGGGANSCFDVGELSFNPFFSNQLISIDNPGGAYGHGSNTYEIEVRVNGNWESIHSQPVSGNTLLSGISTPIDFPTSRIDGVRLRGVPPDNCTFHNFGNEMTFTFNVVNVAVPSLSNASRLALVLVLLMSGLYFRRRWLDI